MSAGLHPWIIVAVLAVPAMSGCLDWLSDDDHFEGFTFTAADGCPPVVSNCGAAEGDPSVPWVIEGLHLVADPPPHYPDGFPLTGLRMELVDRSLELRNTQVEGFANGILIEGLDCQGCDVVVHNVTVVVAPSLAADPCSVMGSTNGIDIDLGNSSSIRMDKITIRAPGSGAYCADEKRSGGIGGTTALGLNADDISLTGADLVSTRPTAATAIYVGALAQAQRVHIEDVEIRGWSEGIRGYETEELILHDIFLECGIVPLIELFPGALDDWERRMIGLETLYYRDLSVENVTTSGCATSWRMVSEGIATADMRNVHVVGGTFGMLMGSLQLTADLERPQSLDFSLSDSVIQNVTAVGFAVPLGNEWPDNSGLVLENVAFLNNGGDNTSMPALHLEERGGLILPDFVAHRLLVRESHFEGNHPYAIYVHAYHEAAAPVTNLLDARDNWWGHASGPRGGYNDVVGLATGTPQGDAVSDGVLVHPYKTEP